MTVDQIIAKFSQSGATIERSITIGNLTYEEALEISTELERSGGVRVQNGFAANQTYYVRIEDYWNA